MFQQTWNPPGVCNECLVLIFTKQSSAWFYRMVSEGYESITLILLILIGPWGVTVERVIFHLYFLALCFFFFLLEKKGWKVSFSFVWFLWTLLLSTKYFYLTASRVWYLPNLCDYVLISLGNSKIIFKLTLQLFVDYPE